MCGRRYVEGGRMDGGRWKEGVRGRRVEVEEVWGQRKKGVKRKEGLGETNECV